MIEIGITPKIIFKRKAHEKLYPDCDSTMALCYDDNLLVFGYFSREDVEAVIKIYEKNGAKFGEDFTTSEMGDIDHPVDWLIHPDRQNRPLECEYFECEYNEL